MTPKIRKTINICALTLTLMFIGMINAPILPNYDNISVMSVYADPAGILYETKDPVESSIVMPVLLDDRNRKALLKIKKYVDESRIDTIASILLYLSGIFFVIWILTFVFGKKR